MYMLYIIICLPDLGIYANTNSLGISIGNTDTI